MYTIDFETEGIEGNPLVNPPRPIGVGMKRDNLPAVYHVGEDMKPALLEAWFSDEELIFQNAPFDIRVAEYWLGLPVPNWFRVHDTKFLIYLFDPHAKSVSLKPSAERILGLKLDERDDLRDWVLANVSEATAKSWGAHICKAPVELVSKYCMLDCNLTWDLFLHLYTRVPRDAYNLERELSLHLMTATQGGIRVDLERLERDYHEMVQVQQDSHNRIFKQLGEFEITNATQLANALERAGEVTEWIKTPTGKRSTSRENLISVIKTPSLATELSYSGGLQTLLGTYMTSWISLAQQNGGLLHPSWNQVRNDDDKGTRTGRLSCSGPNIQNVPKPLDIDIPDGLRSLPNMRDYLLPEEGQIWSSRDFSAQEMRLLAHFEDGLLLKGFQKDPSLDPHAFIQWLIEELTGVKLSRKHIKGVSFGMIYGMGVPGLSKQLGIDVVECDRIVSAYHKAIPGVRELQRLTKSRGKANQAIRTIGGREYYAEAPTIVGNSKRSYEYKLLNYLIQGSAADQTKRALLHYFNNKPAGEKFLCTVHDEINISIDPSESDTCLAYSMEKAAAVGLDVPMQTTLETGPNWGALS